MGILKIFLFLSAWLLLWAPIAIVLGRKLKWDPRRSIEPGAKLPLVASLYALAPLIIWGLLKLEKTTPRDYGLNFGSGLGISLIVGFTIALVGLTAVFAIESLTGLIIWQRENLKSALSLTLPLLAVSLWVGFTEELIFRGIFFDLLNADSGFWGAALLSSLIFALLHLIWERQETVPQLPGLWLMGMVLVWALTIDSGSIGLAWGLHAGWVFGIALLDSAALIRYTDTIPWITGIFNRPLAGLMGLLCLGVTGLVLAPIFNYLPLHP